MKRLLPSVIFITCLFARAASAQAPPVTFGNQLDFNFFEANVATVFKDVCAGCHGGGNAAARYGVRGSRVQDRRSACLFKGYLWCVLLFEI
jgi:hypothetical protein